MPLLSDGQLTWSADQDREGYRTYKITFQVIASYFEGPAAVLACPGLPDFGSVWAFDGDADVWAWCTHECSAKPVEERAPNYLWSVEKTFTTKPPDAEDRPCKDDPVEDPLTEPPKISGSFSKNKLEATKDKDGNAILNSAFEQLRGASLEFDDDRVQVKIEFNVPDLDKAFWASFRNCVNQYPLWGMEPRCVKLSESDWELKFWGACSYYYTLSLTFDLDPATFDRDILDEASKVLNGHWDKDTGEWVLDDVGAVAPPGAPTVTEVIGGTLSGHVYHYKLTSTTSKGETTAGAIGTFDLSVGTGALKVDWTAAAGATGYKVYRATDGGAYGLIKTITGGSTVTWTDDGTFSEGAAPPTSSTAGGFSPDASNPGHFIRWKDRNGENMRGILNGAGVPAKIDVEPSDEGKIHVAYYPEADFTLLGIPLSI